MDACSTTYRRVSDGLSSIYLRKSETSEDPPEGNDTQMVAIVTTLHNDRGKYANQHWYAYDLKSGAFLQSGNIAL